MKSPDPVRWFDALGTCRCGKPAHGKLMGTRNESYGIACTKCANARLRLADKSRAVAAEAEERAEMVSQEGIGR